MANLNLSQFTEKLFVADADHTFIWDTAASISKRVSRNSWLNSGTLTSDAPVTISQTWNNAAVAFTGLKVNAVSTASAAASLLLDLQVGTVSQFSVRKDGAITGSTKSVFGGGFGNLFTGRLHVGDYNFSVGSNSLVQIAIEVDGADAENAVILNKDAGIYWSSVASAGNIIGLRAAADLALRRDSANTLALRNGANAQTFNVYGTYTSGTSYERLTLSAPSAANAIIGTNKGSGGGTARGLEFQTDGVTRMTIAAAGGVTVTGVTTSSGGFSATGLGFSCLTTGFIYWASSTTMSAPSDGLLRITNTAGNDFNRIQFGGTTDAFPSIARDGAGIKFTGAAAGSTSWIKVPPVSVASLPAAATAGAGARAFVNDALTPVFGSAVTGGGAVAVPVYSTGAAWNVG